jgi:hypothetical protein
MASDQIPLRAMSNRQRRVVERNLPLVRLTLRRHSQLSERNRVGREPVELFQEGCIALMEAVRSHDPMRHGHFGAYAMARIHFAVSRYVHETKSVIRVPFITQRRRRKRQEPATADRHGPDRLPRVVCMADNWDAEARRGRRRRQHDPTVSPAQGLTIGELVRERLDQATARVVRDMKAAPGCADGHRDVVEQCATGRWLVPEPDARTPIRQLARTLHCSVGRITHCEERFHKKVAETLNTDDVFRELTRLARCQPTGMNHCPSPEEMASLQLAANDTA